MEKETVSGCGWSCTRGRGRGRRDTLKKQEQYFSQKMAAASTTQVETRQESWELQEFLTLENTSKEEIRYLSMYEY